MLKMQLRIDYPSQVNAVVLFPVEIVFFVFRRCIDFDETTINCSHNLWEMVLFFKVIHYRLNFVSRVRKSNEQVFLSAQSFFELLTNYFGSRFS